MALYIDTTTPIYVQAINLQWCGKPACNPPSQEGEESWGTAATAPKYLLETSPDHLALFKSAPSGLRLGTSSTRPVGDASLTDLTLATRPLAAHTEFTPRPSECTD